MTTNINFIGGHERIAYTIEHRGDCVLIDGPVPMSKFEYLTKLAPPGSVLDSDTARVLGVTFAMGPAEDLQALREAGADAAYRRERASRPGLSDAAVRWLASGERGLSSNAMFTRLTGIDATDGREADRVAHPRDPADFRRCRLLLEQAPELGENLVKMRSLSDAWRGLIDDWTNICATMDWEAPDWRSPDRSSSAPATYQLIRRATGR